MTATPRPALAKPTAAATPLVRRVSPIIGAANRLVGRATAANRLPLIAYGLYTLALFVVCLAATFPHELVLSRILARSATDALTTEVRGVRLGWRLAYTLDEVRVFPRGGEGGAPLLAATGVRLAPAFLGLLRGHPYPLGVRAGLYDGTLAATVDLRPAAFDVRATLEAVDLARYAGALRLVEGALRGRVSGTVTLGGNAHKPTTFNGRIDLDAVDLALEGGAVRGITIPALHFPTVDVAGTVRGGRLELTTIAARGREVSLGGEGTVLLQEPLATSLINLTLTLRPAPEIPPELRLALNLVPGEVDAEGARTLRLVGSLAQPRLP